MEENQKSAMEKDPEEEGLKEFLIRKIMVLKEWLKPVPGDALPLQILKTILKSIAVLILIAVSPVVIVILILVFFVTL